MQLRSLSFRGRDEGLELESVNWEKQVQIFDPSERGELMGAGRKTLIFLMRRSVFSESEGKIARIQAKSS